MGKEVLAKEHQGSRKGSRQPLFSSGFRPGGGARAEQEEEADFHCLRVHPAPGNKYCSLTRTKVAMPQDRDRVRVFLSRVAKGGRVCVQVLGSTEALGSTHRPSVFFTDPGFSS